MNIIRLSAISILSASLLGIQPFAMAQNLPAQEVPEGARQSAGPRQYAARAIPGSAPATPPNPKVVAFVDQQFPVADANKDGTLTAAEFTAWASGLKNTERQKAGQRADAMAARAYADGALRAADRNKDQLLTKTELADFFGG